MGEFSNNSLDLKPLHDAKSLYEEFARRKGFKLKLIKTPWSDNQLVWIRYGKYSLKYFDSLDQRCEKKARDVPTEQLCDLDGWFFPGKFNGWLHFGQCSGLAELAIEKYLKKIEEIQRKLRDLRNNI